MIIVGAGLAGLLAANMLRHKSPVVMEKQSGLPNNHSAVLRFRSDVIGNVTGIEFKKVQVIKGALKWKNPVADALAYAYKNTGTLLSNRSIPAEVEVVERYIAPQNLIEQLASVVPAISYSVSTSDWLGNESSPYISTIPMPDLMDILHYPRPEFKSINGTNISAKVRDCDAYVSLYVPSPLYPFSRISLMGDELVIEIPRLTITLEELKTTDSTTVNMAAALLGIDKGRLSDVNMHQQRYAKIQEIDEGIRKRFIAWASDEHNIYSLGRYACWRPGLLLDDLVKDIRLIEMWIKGGQYAMRKHR